MDTAEPALTPEDKEAYAQAFRDSEAWAKLEEERLARLAARTGEATVLDEESEDLTATAAEALRPLNRAERRSMVAQFKRNLRMMPSAVPTRNATIISKSKRRRKRR